MNNPNREKCLHCTNIGCKEAEWSPCLCKCHAPTKQSEEFAKGIKDWEKEIHEKGKYTCNKCNKEDSGLIHCCFPKPSSELAQEERKRCDKCNNFFEENHWQHYSPRENKWYHTGCFTQYKFPSLLQKVKEDNAREFKEMVKKIGSEAEKGIENLTYSGYLNHFKKTIRDIASRINPKN